MTQAVRRSPPTAAVPSSRLGHSMWVSLQTKQSLGRFLSGFLQFSPATNFITQFIHTHRFHFISSAPVMMRQAWSAGTNANHRCSLQTLHHISSLDPTFLPTRVEEIQYEVFNFLLQFNNLRYKIDFHELLAQIVTRMNA